jgi:excisionase family DNA binding protein
MDGGNMQTLLVDVETARIELGGISRSKLYSVMASGALRSVSLGRRRFIPRQALLDYIQRLSDGQDADKGGQEPAP